MSAAEPPPAPDPELTPADMDKAYDRAVERLRTDETTRRRMRQRMDKLAREWTPGE